LKLSFVNLVVLQASKVSEAIFIVIFSFLFNIITNNFLGGCFFYKLIITKRFKQCIFGGRVSAC
ncbi:hypothetical protein RFF73_10820, partial [Streptococcus ruminantium]|nr:hypothetical protein [Streptococcus ruminantium]